MRLVRSGGKRLPFGQRKGAREPCRHAKEQQRIDQQESQPHDGIRPGIEAEEVEQRQIIKAAHGRMILRQNRRLAHITFRAPGAQYQ